MNTARPRHRRRRRRQHNIIQQGMENIYYDATNVASYGGASRLQKSLKAKTLKQTKDWLRTEPTYSLHKPLRKTFPTRKYRTSGPNELWQMDLMEMIPYARINKGYCTF